MSLSTDSVIVILGPTACGKTSVATHLAAEIGAEIVSADSRQVYRGMDLGTGKDISEYVVDGVEVPYHLIDIVEPGSEYNLFFFQNDFINAFNGINKRGNYTILCGGTGMYINSILKKNRLLEVPINEELRIELRGLPVEELQKRVVNLKSLHNTTDLLNVDRLVRAIEIGEYEMKNRDSLNSQFPEFKSLVFGINYDREIVMKRINDRLKQRLESGMIEEVEKLMETGVTAEMLLFYGLEYRYITRYILGEIDYNEMFTLLNIAIRQFAKRQMTYFRRMEREGVNINWIPEELNTEEKVAYIREYV